MEMPEMSDRHAKRLDVSQAQLLVVDVQERLLPLIHNHESLVARAERMIRAAKELELPTTVSEQYPQGLGPTVAPISEAAAEAPRVQKMTFSYCADGGCRERILGVQRPQILMVGIEAHVCVQQTVLDLLDLHMQPFVLADAIGSRRLFDYEFALQRMQAAGAVLTTVESVILEMVHDSGTELFKRILPLIR